jgi:hypothetical protein
LLQYQTATFFAFLSRFVRASDRISMVNLVANFDSKKIREPKSVPHPLWLGILHPPSRPSPPLSRRVLPELNTEIKAMTLDMQVKHLCRHLLPALTGMLLLLLCHILF